ncbi:XkdX family protein [Bacillus safensis]|nr:XkdX family protein [Bacillus safensis]MCY7542516.1 XkdX family protein [Bacillus safensis]MCY7552391.1 XkdX family protein [Bacillus safensis]MCY7644822.1 XkdX family protein [Bacillus safensis]MCY7655863.1 XkdX family protein [Bacillus safensis]MEC3710337.1 XkdX family protein [Bacillus safensis]
MDIDWFDTVQMFYLNEYWSKERVRIAVEMGKITAEQYEIIVGEPY